MANVALNNSGLGNTAMGRNALDGVDAQGTSTNFAGAKPSGLDALLAEPRFSFAGWNRTSGFADAQKPPVPPAPGDDEAPPIIVIGRTMAATVGGGGGNGGKGNVLINPNQYLPAADGPAVAQNPTSEEAEIVVHGKPMTKAQKIAWAGALSKARILIEIAIAAGIGIATYSGFSTRVRAVLAALGIHVSSKLTPEQKNEMIFQFARVLYGQDGADGTWDGMDANEDIGIY